MTSKSPTPVILDVDTGVDDALAIALACRLAELEVIGVTTVAGNVDQQRATENTRRVLHLLDAGDVPVAPGMTGPLIRPHRDALAYHGPNGLGGLELPPSPGRMVGAHAPEFIIQAAQEHEGELVLICLAPLSNLAVALLLEPELPRLLKRVVIMGGAFTVAGNITPWAEFNIFVDPEAAAIVARSQLPLTFIGLDVTTRVRFTREQWERCRGLDHPEARLITGVSVWAFEHRQVDAYALHDPLAVAVAAVPDLVGVEPAEVVIDTGLWSTAGQTKMVRSGGQASEHLVALEVDVERFVALFAGALRLPIV
ncbi:Pyrimidine-specific ribonucleoside hydrolase RihA [bacterium HR26]|nr:Pyrimidine-specific ribonucleoside hydrolase RihA [bacterium HR26]